MKLYQILENQLKKEPNYISDEGEIKKWVVINKAQNFDEELIELLLQDKEVKETFFKEIAGVTVFNQSKFIQFLEQKNYLNDSYTQYRNKIGLSIGGKFLNQRNEVALVWPFKDCILEGGQSREEDKREEIFFNEVLAQDEITQLLEPKILTQAKVFTKEGEQEFSGFNRNEEGTITDNLIIKGNNLLALHSLKNEFAGKVKLIYIDPPYNTGNDSFGYNDSFNRSTWLTFMKNRLEVARNLLRDDGAIFVQCDYNEQAYLKVLMDEVFGVNQLVSNISIKSSTPSGVKTSHATKKILKSTDYILVYKKSEVTIKPQYTKKQSWDTHYSFYIKDNSLVRLIDILKEKKMFTEKDRLKDFDISNNKHRKFYIEHGHLIVRKSTHTNKRIKTICNSPDYKNKIYKENNNFYLNNDMLQPISKSIELVFNGQRLEKHISNLLCDFWDDIDFQNTQNQGGVSFPAGKKPEQLIYRIIDMITKQGEIVLDYHLGSGTTAAVAHKMNRQYIGIEQMDYIEDVAVKRLKKVVEGEQGGISKSVEWQGGGSFTYLELKKYNQSFIDQIQEAKDSKTLLQIWEEMKERSFLNYNVDIKKQVEHIDEFKVLDLALQKEHLLSILNKNQLYVNLSDMNDKKFTCTAEEKKITQDFYQLKS